MSPNSKGQRRRIDGQRRVDFELSKVAMHGRGPEAAIRSPRQKGRPSLPASVLITVIGVALFASNIFLGAKGIDKPGVHIHPLEMGVEVWFWDAVRTVGGIVMILTGLCMGAYAIFGSAADEFIHDESHS